LKKSLAKEIQCVQLVSLFIFSLIFTVASSIIFWGQSVEFQKERLLTLNRLLITNLTKPNVLTKIIRLQTSDQPFELQRMLSPYINQAVAVYPRGYIVGFYSNPLDRVIVAGSRGGEPGLTGGKLPAKDPGRKIWVTKQPLLKTKWSRSRQALVLNYYDPILVKGEVIGYTFAQANLLAFSPVHRQQLFNLFLVLFAGIVSAFLARKKAQVKIKKNIQRLTLLDPQKKFPPFDYQEFDKVAETNHKVFEDLITVEKAKGELLTNFPWGFCIVNSNGILTNINNKGLDLLGLNWEAVIHRGISALGKEFTAVLRAFHEKKAIETELVIPAKDGEKKVLIVNAFPLTINATESGAMACFRDITGQRRMQAMLEHMNRLSIIGEMISIIVHDIRNPLAVMKALAQLCYMKPGANYRLNCKKIDHLTEEINSYLGKIMTFAKPANESPAVFTVKELFENVLILLKGKLNASQVEVESWFADPEPYIFVNQLDFQYTLHTLLNNAVDMIDGPGKIAFQADYDHGMVRLMIADSSPGLPKKDLEQIWDTDIGVRPKGMTIGLAMCKRLIEQFEGEIIVTSEIGQGTVFTIMLPQAHCEQPDHSLSG
jgi:two-component system, sporulation sensor kinase E